MFLDQLEDRLLLTIGTILSVNPASGVYGGTTTLAAELTANGTGIPDEPIDFQLGATGGAIIMTDINGIAVFTGASLANFHAGTFTGDVTASFTGDVNLGYTASSDANDLTVTPAPLTITANNQTKVYGAALPTLTASLLRVRQRRHLGQPDHPPTLTTTATASSHVAGSPYAITASGAVDTDYTISYVAGSLTVTTAPLTITADNQTKVYGAALPTLTASLLRVRQRRHFGQPDHPAHAHHDRHRRQPRRRQPLRHHRQRRGRHRLHDQLRRRQPDRHHRRR